MSTFLVLTSEYLNRPAANGICAFHLAEALKEMGHELRVVCYGKPEEESETVKTVAAPQKKQRKSLFSRYAYRAWELLHTLVSPMVRRRLAREYEKKASEFLENEKIDGVVGVYFPLESLTALTRLKKKHPKTSFFIYELDSVGDGIGIGQGFYQTRMVRAYNRYLTACYREADAIVVMRSHEEYWKKSFALYQDKLIVADIPVLVEKSLPAVEKEEGAPVSFLYGGLMEREYRSPEHLLRVFSLFSKEQEATLDFFSKGDCEALIAAAAKNDPAIRQNGYVAPAVLDEAVARADVLVSIGNRVSRSVPSKVVGYLAYGKPVVHFSSQREDVCAFYLEKYPLGLVLKEWDSAEENARKLSDFVAKTKGQRAEFAAVEAALPMNTPRYSAQRIAENKGEAHEQ